MEITNKMAYGYLMSTKQRGSTDPTTGRAELESTSEQVPRDKPSPCAWLASAAIKRNGRRCDIPEGGALTIVAVSVHEQYSEDVQARLELMHDVARFNQVPSNVPSLWVFPAGYFGFRAAEWSNGNRNNAWANLDPGDIKKKLSRIAEPFPIGAWIAFGVDYPSVDRRRITQEVWVVRRIQVQGEEQLKPKIITRKSRHEDQCVHLDDQGFKAAFYVCNEIAGYHGQHSDCRLVVDLAHVRVPGTVRSNRVGVRMAHQRALEMARLHGAAVLTHHHGGKQIGKRPQDRHQSNWIMFQGAEPDWLDSSEVEEVP